MALPRSIAYSLSLALLLSAAFAQNLVPPDTAGARPALSIHHRVSAGQPFTVAGSRGVLLGQQEGTFEAWVLPVKVLSQFQIEAEVDGYAVPIDVNRAAAAIEVYPDHTTITYAHIAFTLRQTMFAPEEGPAGTGATVVFMVDSTRPVNLIFRFTPEMRPMWPAPGNGMPSAEWVASASAYVLHTDLPGFAGAVAMPGAQPGILAPYQEKPQTHPLEFKIRYDPAHDRGRSFPLLLAVGQTTATATRAALLSTLAALAADLPRSYRANAERYAALQHDLTSIHTPDRNLDDAFSWAEISIEQLRARLQPTGETGLVAGYYASGDSARPGFGWYFGRDTLYTLYAVDGMGDFRLARESLAFLIGRQSYDGKIMHEYSQTAPLVDWKSLPYLYAAADATPLFLLATLDYVRASGDTAFLSEHRDAVRRAWQFETTHDSDGDGIYDNAQGTGWVESWPGGMPHQEIYLALLDQQASAAMASLAGMLGDSATADAARVRASRLTETIEREYHQSATSDYAFSRNPDGTLDHAATIYPMLAWWSGGPGLQDAAKSFRRWASHDFSTDWGPRDVAESDPVYDPISYHQGSVWPLFTGWAAIAEYRSGHILSGYSHLRQNADQTTTQDLGAVTELLSGAYFQPFGRSTSHQLWSSAMVITPILRGLLGLTIDAAAHTVTVAPHLPADWPGARIEALHVGESSCTVTFQRRGADLKIDLATTSGPPVFLSQEGSPGRSSISLPLPTVEVALPQVLPQPGSPTTQVKVLSEMRGLRSLTLELEGQALSEMSLVVRVNGKLASLRAQGATLGSVRADGLRSAETSFPAGVGYVSKFVTFTW